MLVHFLDFLVHGKIAWDGPKWGRESLFPANPDLVDILGDTDFEFENFHSIRFAQSAGPVFYRFGSLFESIVTPWGHFWRPWEAAFRSKNRLWRPRCLMNPQHRNKTTLLDTFWDPKNHKQVTRTIL